MNLVPYVIGWAILATVVIVVAVYRNIVAKQEDDALHVSEATAEVATTHQTEMAKRLETLDRWGKILTVVALLYGLGLAAGYLYLGWVRGVEFGG